MAATDELDNQGNINQTAEPDEIALLNAPPPDEGKEKPTASPEPSSEAAEGHEDDDGEGEGDDTAKRDAELEAAADDAEREEIRKRRREERKNKRERDRAKRDELERLVRAQATQLTELRQQVSGIQNINHGNQLAQLDHHIQQHQNAVGYFENLMAEAITKGDGAAQVEALRARDAARDKLRDLEGLKARVTSPAKTQPTVNPVMVEHVKTFLGKHKWYGGPQSTDIDSRMLKVIDDSVAADGFDPTTPAYYEELEKRGRERLPHRFSAASPAPQQQQQRQQRQPVAGAGGDSGGKPGGGADFQVSAERVKAMKEAGIWDDPTRRANMIKRYREMDKAASK